MAEFLTGQLDYVFFVYGLALVLLGAVAATMTRAGSPRLPWGWVSAFAFTHGVVEWLQLGALAAGEPPALTHLLTVLLLASYLVLLEFARRGSAVVHGTGPGPWILLLPVALVSGAVLVGGEDALRPAMRVVVALPATLWAATVMGEAALQREREMPGRGRALGWAAVWLALYGIAAGVVLPGTAFVPAGWPTREGFLAATGVPIQLVRAATVSMAALGVWAHATSLDAHGRVHRKRWKAFWGAAVTLVAVLLGGWLVTDWLGRLHDRDLEGDAEAATALVQDHLVMELEATSESARIAARFLSSFDLAPAIARGGSSQLDDLTDALAGREEGRVAYLLDPTGKVVASSNRSRPDTFVGKSYDHRPYFKQALGGAAGRYVGVGISSGKPSFYASEPIRDAAGAIIGVAVVKHILGAESFGPLGTGTSFLVGPKGEVLVAASEGEAGRPLWSAAPGVARDGSGPSIAILEKPVAGTEWVRVGGVRNVAVRMPLPALDWSIVTLRKETLRGPNRILGIVIALLLSVVIVSSFVILQRQFGAESRLTQQRHEAEGRAREAARRADTDALTGIANRQGFNDVMAREFARARRFRQPLAMVLIDLDHFKRVNDQHGHAAGDQVLANTARVLASRVRESDFVARWGGEEFALIASMTDAAGAARLAEKLRALLEVTPVGPLAAVTASFGVAEMRPDDTIESMIQRADDALYQAKRAGRNQVSCSESWVDMGAVALAESQGRVPAAGRARQLYADTGYAPIDDDHRDLSRLIASVVTLAGTGEPAQARPALAALLQRAAEHFAHEETLMRRHGHAPRAAHEEAHTIFVADARRFQAELERSGITPAYRQWARTRLPEWFRYHVLAHDLALANHLVTVADRVDTRRRNPEGVEA